MLKLLLSLILTIVLFNTVEIEAQTQCRTPNQQPGICIILNDCQPLYSLIRKGNLTQTQIEYLRQSQCGQVNKQVMVCCPSAGQFQRQQQQHSSIAATTLNRPTSPKQNKKPIQLNSVGSSLFPKPGVCGKGAEQRVFGGTETDLGEYPWVALVGWDSRNGDGSQGFHCGGSLINNRYVLTAAHCIKSTSLPQHWEVTRVRLGEWNTDTVKDCKKDISGYVDCADPAIDIPIESITVHENYDGGSTEQYHDIALLRLSQTVSYTPYISPICLPFNNNLRNSNLEGNSFDVVGWGRTESKVNSNVKLKALVDTFDLNKCNQVFAQSAIQLQNGQICAGGKKGIDSCSGDSGGPLIGRDISNKALPNYFLAGIVSFGSLYCGSEGWPGVYTRVGQYVDWIQNNVKP